MSQFLSIIGWSFLPGVSLTPPPELSTSPRPRRQRKPARTGPTNLDSLKQLATSWIQTIYYGLTIRAGDPKPAPGSPRHASHRRVIHILVIAAYLAYTIYEADYELRAASDFYADLGLAPGAPDRDVKTRFRRLAALHHPDKAGSGGGDDGGGSTTARFIHLKLASDTLLNAARRFAYERFGPDVVDWQKCVTVRDFVSRGVLSGVLPHYAVAAATIYVLGLLGYMDFGKFYRWLILVSLCVFELHAATRPSFPRFLAVVNAVVTRLSLRPPYLPFQFIQLARKLTITTYIALSQIGPLLVEHTQQRQRAAQDDERALQQALQRLEGVTGQLNADAGRLMDMEIAPFKGDPEAVGNLQGKMREWLVQNTIRADPMVRDALGTSFRKRRIDAPSGARGNR
ncbi:hypothetical protein JDV02_006670 [Purpureocillium takamizusanense]|uniref:J domain-containing protein n=1 Tax=Purpureocillium takamizusanense TaxID=2060973 RepID=A0A9Q8VD68_9HYPO|nr:uncharacterized protein JDV02_006670 [Purpureocillium takamizusanense]UNI20599.1 hypothetical protein JDV02_006670 [Purpureocillium takamizusanense]